MQRSKVFLGFLMINILYFAGYVAMNGNEFYEKNDFLSSLGIILFFYSLPISVIDWGAFSLMYLFRWKIQLKFLVIVFIVFEVLFFRMYANTEEIVYLTLRFGLLGAFFIFIRQRCWIVLK